MAAATHVKEIPQSCLAELVHHHVQRRGHQQSAALCKLIPLHGALSDAAQVASFVTAAYFRYQVLCVHQT